MQDLIEALTIFARYTQDRCPTCCQHDVLYVNVGYEKVSEADKKRLDELGFFKSDEGVASCPSASGRADVSHDPTNPYDPRNVEAVLYTPELLERGRLRLKGMGEALRARFQIPPDQSVREYLGPRLRSCEIDEDLQIQEWIELHSLVLNFSDAFEEP
jgi:hypothetical protein